MNTYVQNFSTPNPAVPPIPATAPPPPQSTRRSRKKAPLSAPPEPITIDLRHVLDFAQHARELVATAAVLTMYSRVSSSLKEPEIIEEDLNEALGRAHANLDAAVWSLRVYARKLGPEGLAIVQFHEKVEGIDRESSRLERLEGPDAAS